MKTPREILSEKHQSMDAKLDALRREVIAENVVAPQFVRPRRNSLSPSFIFSQLWLELILPCRRVWFGLAAVWLAILVVNFAASDDSTRAPQMAANKASSPNPEVMAALKEQKMWMTQMLEPAAPPAARATVPGPRTERRNELVVV